MQRLGSVQVRRRTRNVSTALVGIAHLPRPHARGRFEELFQKRGELQEESLKFLLFVKEKLPLGEDRQKEEWICTQAARAMETFAPENYYKPYSDVIDLVRWRGLQFAPSVYVIFDSSFRSSAFGEALLILKQGSAAVR